MSPKTLERLRKLIPLLGSDKDGEVLATVHAIRAALASEALDLHDLAASVSGDQFISVARAAQIAAAPTWEILTHQDRRGWMRIIIADPNLGPLERDRLAELDALLRTGMVVSYPWRRVRIFDERLANCHARGMRP